jgi:hypothetical protein
VQDDGEGLPAKRSATHAATSAGSPVGVDVIDAGVRPILDGLILLAEARYEGLRDLGTDEPVGLALSGENGRSDPRLRHARRPATYCSPGEHAGVPRTCPARTTPTALVADRDRRSGQPRFRRGVALVVFVRSTDPEGPCDFYVAPSPLPSGPPGTVIRMDELEESPEGSVDWKILYLSKSFTGRPSSAILRSEPGPSRLGRETGRIPKAPPAPSLSVHWQEERLRHVVSSGSFGSRDARGPVSTTLSGPRALGQEET